MIDLVLLKWYEKMLNEVLVLVNNIKINKTSHGTWITNGPSANVTSGKQGAKCPTNTTDTTNTIQIQPDVPQYLYKPSELSFKEVRMSLERYTCPICRKNNHTFHTCHALHTTYNISLKQLTSNPTSDTTPSSTQPATTPQPVMVKRAITSVNALSDVPTLIHFIFKFANKTN